VKNVAGRVDVLGRRAGRHLRHSGGWRSAVILYVLSLHSLAFLVLAWRALGSHGSIERRPPGAADPAWDDHPFPVLVEGGSDWRKYGKEYLPPKPPPPAPT
jgi:hypothetical protein